MSNRNRKQDLQKNRTESKREDTALRSCSRSPQFGPESFQVIFSNRLINSLPKIISSAQHRPEVKVMCQSRLIEILRQCLKKSNLWCNENVWDGKAHLETRSLEDTVEKIIFVRKKSFLSWIKWESFCFYTNRRTCFALVWILSS